MENKRIAIFAPYIGNIGTERVMINLAKGFAEKGNKVYLLRTYKEWMDWQNENGMIRVVDMNTRHLINLFPKTPSYRIWLGLLTFELLPKLIWYLSHERIDVMITGLLGGIAVLGRELGNSATKIIVSVQGLPRVSGIRKFFWKWIYPRAEMIVIPCESLSYKVEKLTGIPREKIKVIPNPVIDDGVLQKAKESLEHPWFQKGKPPVILGVGRLTRQKDFLTLIRAFGYVRKEINARLVILGEGEDRDRIETLAKELGVIEDMDLPGFVDNPYNYMAQADLFVLSSRWEGPGHVLIEAQALGTPVVATDCPMGPREILLGGRTGVLIPVGDYKSMADAIIELLSNQEKAKELAKRGLDYIDRFCSGNVVEKYLNLIENLQKR